MQKHICLHIHWILIARGALGGISCVLIYALAGRDGIPRLGKKTKRSVGEKMTRIGSRCELGLRFLHKFRATLEG